MPFVVPPSVKPYIRNGKHESIVSFVWQAPGAVGAVPNPIPGFIGQDPFGALLSIDLSQLNTNKPIAPIRSVRFSMGFYQGQNNTNQTFALDGNFYIYSPAMGEVIRVPQPAISNENNGVNTLDLPWGIISGSIPIETSDSPVITFFKGNHNAAGIAQNNYGTLACSLLTFDNPHYMMSAYSQNG